MLRPAGACLRRERGTGVEGGVRARLPPTSLSILLHSLLKKKQIIGFPVIIGKKPEESAELNVQSH